MENREHDDEIIMRRLVGQDFPWDYQRSMVDLVFMKGLAAPRISGLIGAQGYIQKFPQKRYDDTSILLMEFVKHGYSSERGQRAIARLNEVHSRFRIRQVDYLYVLTSLMFEPIRWNERFGWRPMTEEEKQANFRFWREVGLRMDLTIIPETYEECERFNVEYEREELVRTNMGVALGEVLFELLRSWVPKPVRPLVRPGMSALLDDTLLSYFDVPPAPAWLKWVVPRALKLRARTLRWLPKRRRARSYIDRKIRSYPHGYALTEVGPPDDWRGSRPRDAGPRDERFCRHEVPAEA